MGIKYRTSAGTSASNFSDLVVKVGDTLPIGTEVDYDGQSVPAGWEEVEETNLGDVVVDSIRTKNLLDTNRVGKLVGTLVEQLSNGLKAIVLSNAQYQYAVVELDRDLLGKTLTLSATITPSASNTGRVSVVFTDNSYALVGSSIQTLSDTGNITFTIPSSFPSGATKICTLFYSNFAGTGVANNYVNYTNVQLEEGSTATTYKPHIDLNNQNVNTIGEQRIGTWIDGKPLYRTIIPITTISSSANNYDAIISIRNLKEIVNLTGSVKPNFSAWKPINNFYINSSGTLEAQYAFQVYSISNSIITLSYGNWWKSVFEKAIIIVEYTKTTD